MLIGLHGRKQAGKDTVYQRAARLMEEVLPVERVSFADLLYRSAAASLGVTVDVLQRWKSDPHAKVRVSLPPPYGIASELSVREYLQRYGTEAHREIFGPDFWVNAVDLSHGGSLVMVTDVRFPNEALAVRAAGGEIVHVIGPPEVEHAADGHASEAGLSEEFVDHVLLNTVRDDDFRALDTQVEFLLRLLLRREEEAFSRRVDA